MVTVRAARTDDIAAIRAVLTAAFPTPDEADLVDRLRADGDILLEWVAVADGALIGAIQYSPLALRRDGRADGHAAALAPVAVLPEHQGQGVGARLIDQTLTALTERELETVVVLGHPDYYPRFGFSHEAAHAALIDPFDAGPAFMALPMAQDPARALPLYARAFGLDQ